MDDARAIAAPPGPAPSPGGVRVGVIGGLVAEVRGTACPVPAHPEGTALLAWLALHPGEHPRGALAALLWPALPASNARRGLREALWAVRRSLGPLERAVHDGRETVGLRCDTDLAEFERLLAGGEPARALRLGAGALLAGAGLDEHEWVRAARAQHERRVALVRAQLGADPV
jgi:DNA-binding SARP family transcriptional activator